LLGRHAPVSASQRTGAYRSDRFYDELKIYPVFDWFSQTSQFWDVIISLPLICSSSSQMNSSMIFKAWNYFRQ
jgi:hypothetical protein